MCKKTFSLLNEDQYNTIGAFWDEMSDIYGLENLQGLGLNWKNGYMDYVIGLKNGIIPNANFVVELPDNNTSVNNTTNSINLARTLNSDVDEMSPNSLKFTTNNVREYDLEYSSDVEIEEEIEIEYTISDIDYSDSKYNDRKLALSIVPISSLSVINSYIEYNNEIYYLNSNNYPLLFFLIFYYLIKILLNYFLLFFVLISFTTIFGVFLAKKKVKEGTV